MDLTPLSRRSTHEQTRQRILTKAGELFRHFGLVKTTVADIAAGLAMSPANIYKFFPCKHAIIEASLEQELAEVKKSIEAVISSSPGALLGLCSRFQELPSANHHENNRSWHSNR